MKKILALSVLSTALAAPANAAPTISAQSIIVNPLPSTVSVRVWTDRDSSGAATPDYAPGEKIRLYTSVSQDAYVYLFNVDPNGQVDLILPNRYQSGANFLKAGAVKVFPAAGDAFTFDIAAPYGVNKVLALASKTQLNLSEIATFKSQQNSFASVNVQGQGELAQALSIVVTPVPQNSWDSATAFYRVANRVANAPGQAAPLQTAPMQTQPVRAQPLAVQPAPQTAQALSIAVSPAAPLPWGNAREWKTSVDNRSDLRAIHDEYAARLKASGYSLTKTDTKNNEIKSEFRRSGGGKAELSVKRKGGRVEIKVERD
ncbi:DUF4384 domain-containing protein [Deinococcus koreensis]|uniref:S-layer protein n=1 Tax=Deinococcus koreensis TaxID=2054903 RepID=A0A2K3UYH3_9DEIO|nr:DUF4384 domain-containing protein [Deinococcus koreensis]PNY81587.1 S-layer protein [Deinococcus koreensis]